jgi:hypothetical protein
VWGEEAGVIIPRNAVPNILVLDISHIPRHYIFTLSISNAFFVERLEIWSFVIQ